MLGITSRVGDLGPGVGMVSRICGPSGCASPPPTVGGLCPPGRTAARIRAVGVGVGYFVMRSRAGLTGCLVKRENGQMELVGKKPADTYVLQYNSSVSLRPGERVKLKGKKVHVGSGQNIFEVHALAKDYGACS